MSTMRWIRIVAFAIIYFSIYVISAVFKTIESLVGSPELTWYLENPSATLFKTSVKILFVELPRNFLLMPMLHPCGKLIPSGLRNWLGLIHSWKTYRVKKEELWGRYQMHAPKWAVDYRREEVRRWGKWLGGSFIEPGVHCGSSSLRDVFEFHGYKFSEEMIFGLDCGLGFVYWPPKGGHTTGIYWRTG